MGPRAPELRSRLGASLRGHSLGWGRRAWSLVAGRGMLEVVSWRGLAWHSWPNPKPVTPCHLEAITANDDNRADLAAGGCGPVCARQQKNAACRHLLPPPLPLMFALALAHTAPSGPSCREKSTLELQAWGLLARLVPRNLDQSQETWAWLPALPARSLARDVAPWPQCPCRKPGGCPGWAGFFPQTGMCLISPGPTCPRGPACPLQTDQQRSEEGPGVTVTYSYLASHGALHSYPQQIRIGYN